jgi:hypothetical protein
MIISTSVPVSIAVLNSAVAAIAWTKVGIVCPTFSVPGIFSSRTMFVARKTDVVVANDPTPRLSKKFVTAPVTSPSGVGFTGWPSALATRIPL